MASYKMTYMDARGRGELLRLLFAYKGVEFEDVRISIQDVAEFKKSKLLCFFMPSANVSYTSLKFAIATPFGIIPILETDGKVLSGNGNIARYLGEKFGKQMFH